jgi:uncharacterized protein YggU (UPF0235/DUF167 family)
VTNAFERPYQQRGSPQKTPNYSEFEHELLSLDWHVRLKHVDQNKLSAEKLSRTPLLSPLKTELLNFDRSRLKNPLYKYEPTNKTKSPLLVLDDTSKYQEVRTEVEVISTETCSAYSYVTIYQSIPKWTQARANILLAYQEVRTELDLSSNDISSAYAYITLRARARNSTRVRAEVIIVENVWRNKMSLSAYQEVKTDVDLKSNDISNAHAYARLQQRPPKPIQIRADVIIVEEDDEYEELDYKNKKENFPRMNDLEMGIMNIQREMGLLMNQEKTIKDNKKEVYAKKQQKSVVTYQLEPILEEWKIERHPKLYWTLNEQARQLQPQKCESIGNSEKMLQTEVEILPPVIEKPLFTLDNHQMFKTQQFLVRSKLVKKAKKHQTSELEAKSQELKVESIKPQIVMGKAIQEKADYMRKEPFVTVLSLPLSKGTKHRSKSLRLPSKIDDENALLKVRQDLLRNFIQGHEKNDVNFANKLEGFAKNLMRQKLDHFIQEVEKEDSVLRKQKEEGNKFEGFAKGLMRQKLGNFMQELEKEDVSERGSARQSTRRGDDYRIKLEEFVKDLEKQQMKRESEYQHKLEGFVKEAERQQLKKYDNSSDLRRQQTIQYPFKDATRQLKKEDRSREHTKKESKKDVKNQHVSQNSSKNQQKQQTNQSHHNSRSLKRQQTLQPYRHSRKLKRQKTINSIFDVGNNQGRSHAEASKPGIVGMIKRLITQKKRASSTTTESSSNYAFPSPQFLRSQVGSEAVSKISREENSFTRRPQQNFGVINESAPNSDLIVELLKLKDAKLVDNSTIIQILQNEDVKRQNYASELIPKKFSVTDQPKLRLPNKDSLSSQNSSNQNHYYRIEDLTNVALGPSDSGVFSRIGNNAPYPLGNSFKTASSNTTYPSNIKLIQRQHQQSLNRPNNSSISTQSSARSWSSGQKKRYGLSHKLKGHLSDAIFHISGLPLVDDSVREPNQLYSHRDRERKMIERGLSNETNFHISGLPLVDDSVRKPNQLYSHRDRERKMIERGLSNETNSSEAKLEDEG